MQFVTTVGATDYLRVRAANSKNDAYVTRSNFHGAGIPDAVNVPLGTGTGTKIGTGATQKLGFWGATPVAQRSGAAQAAVATTAATNTSPYGYSQAQADAVVALVNELRAALVAAGIIKGSA